MKSTMRFELILTILVLLTAAVIAGSGTLLRTRLVIEPDTGYRTTVRNDGSAAGNSVVELLQPGGFEWRCVLRDAYQYPFCAFELLLDPDRLRGLDMSGYSTIRLWLDYHGDGRSVRLFLRNFDPRYSVPQDPISTKFNQIEFSPTPGAMFVEFPLSDFYVANWWTTEYRIPPPLGRPQFDNVVVFEIQTGSAAPPGEYRFALQRVELVGQLIPTDRLYLGIMLFWLALIVLFILHRLLTLKRELATRHAREAELLQVNALLDARSRLLEERSRTDHLTGAFNRRAVEEAIVHGLGEWRSHGRPLSLVMLDLDHFKRINDVHGHAVGDAVLAEVAALVQRNSRTNDLFARWGGEEFVLLCRNASRDQAAAFAEKLRVLIAAQRFGPDLEVTASFGVATLQADETLERLFGAADAALYAAKHAGRNQVQVAVRE